MSFRRIFLHTSIIINICFYLTARIDVRHPTSDYQYFTVSHDDVVRSVMSRCIYVIAIHNTKCAVILYIIWMERVREIPTEDDTSTQTYYSIYIYIYLGGTRMLHYIIRTTCYCMARLFLLTMHTFSRS